MGFSPLPSPRKYTLNTLSAGSDCYLPGLFDALIVWGQSKTLPTSVEVKGVRTFARRLTDNQGVQNSCPHNSAVPSRSNSSAAGPQKHDQEAPSSRLVAFSHQRSEWIEDLMPAIPCGFVLFISLCSSGSPCLAIWSRCSLCFSEMDLLTAHSWLLSTLDSRQKSSVQSRFSFLLPP